jgi:hypothetical protein
MSDKTMTPEQIAAALAAPFPVGEIKWRKGTRGGLMLPYVTAATVIKRLNEVLGLHGWWDRYRVLADGSVMCQLTICIGGRSVSRQDVGVPSTQEGSKGRVSDALKRAARKFGVALDLCFLDKAKPTAATAANGPPPAKANTMPRSGPELEHRLAEFDGKLAAQGLIMDGDLLMFVSKAVAAAGHGLDTREWNSEAIKLAVAEAKAFEAKAREKQARQESTRQRIAGKTGA